MGFRVAFVATVNNGLNYHKHSFKSFENVIMLFTYFLGMLFVEGQFEKKDL